MAHRPYPNVDRALKHLRRRPFEVGPAAEPRPLTHFERQLLSGEVEVVQDVDAVVATLTSSTP